MPINKPTPPKQVRHKLTDACPKCRKPLKAKREVLIGIDSTIVGCTRCHVYGVEGDSEFFDRQSMSDTGLEQVLRERAVAIMKARHEAQDRYIEWRPMG